MLVVVASNARRLLANMRGIAKVPGLGNVPIRRHARIREMSRTHVIAFFTIYRHYSCDTLEMLYLFTFYHYLFDILEKEATDMVSIILL